MTNACFVCFRNIFLFIIIIVPINFNLGFCIYSISEAKQNIEAYTEIIKRYVRTAYDKESRRNNRKKNVKETNLCCFFNLF